MEQNKLIKNKEITKKNREVLLEVALFLNKALFNEKIITYKTFKYAEENILKDLKKD